MTYTSSNGVTTSSTILPEHINTSNTEHINNNIPESIDDYSLNAAEMQTLRDPYPSGVSLATTLSEELGGLRHVLQAITQETYWYIDPPTFCENSANYNHGSNTFTLTGLLSAAAITSTGTVTLSGTVAGNVDAGATTSFEITNSATPTVDTQGEIALDTTVTGWTEGQLTWYGTEANYIASFPTDTMTTTDGHILAYSAANDQFEMVAPQSTITLGAEQASTSGTAIDFTSIPSGTKKITIMPVGVSKDGVEELLLQLGDSGGIETSGYLGGVFDSGSDFTSTSGFMLTISDAAAAIHHGSIVLTLENAATFTWVCNAIVARSDITDTQGAAGSKSLTAELDRVRITTTGTPDDFDAGVINIQYE